MTASNDLIANPPGRLQDIETYLEEAERLTASKGQRLTRIRRKVLQLLAESNAPAKAYDLLQNLDGEGSPKPPTIYRALEFLLSVGLAHKIESLNAYVACGHANHDHSAVFLICERCGAAEELNAETTTNALKREAVSAQFNIKSTVIEARGTCRNCSS